MSFKFFTKKKLISDFSEKHQVKRLSKKMDQEHFSSTLQHFLKFLKNLLKKILKKISNFFKFFFSQKNNPGTSDGGKRKKIKKNRKKFKKNV